MGPQHEGQAVVVTGAGHGIGQAIVERFAEAGARVVVNDVDPERVEVVVAGIADSGGTAIGAVADVSDRSQVDTMFDAALEAFGTVDVLVNNAGLVGPMLHFFEADEAWWRRIIDVNLTGVWHCMQQEIPHMITGGGGAMVNTSSVLGLKASQGYSAYIAAKHGVAGLTKAAALEYARFHIRVNAVCPGFIRTQMVEPILDNPKMLKAWVNGQAIRRPGEPQEVAAAVLWLCSDAASFVTGHMMAVDGGQGAQ